MVQCIDAFVGRVQYSRYSLQYRVFSASHHLNTALVRRNCSFEKKIFCLFSTQRTRIWYTTTVQRSNNNSTTIVLYAID